MSGMEGKDSRKSPVKDDHACLHTPDRKDHGLLADHHEFRTFDPVFNLGTRKILELSRIIQV